MAPTPRSVSDLLTVLRTDPGRPRLTWYSGDGERVELSGAVLDNWVSKTANLLVEEFDAGPGYRVLLDLPAHWRSVVWALAAWRVGACVVTPGGDPSPADDTADLVVTDRPTAHLGARDLVAVALPALARRFDAALPAGAIDAAAAVMTYADRLAWAPPVQAGSPALVTPTGTTVHADLFAGPTADDAQRVLLPAGELAATLVDVLGVLSAAGSVVLVDDAFASALRLDAARTTALTTSERVTSDRL
ncbi:TIGR03089 family protein [Cellulomonas sp. NTE-D12]|uniref:TIGR03089 family protein n=1 Tax=Cellulomonas sp. NTE-D12 TaxID=2962632 RepID=UPI003081FAC1|nr:hypothetical protein CELD12_23100 [Cellulomonas sp. NTE-D12]